ncbi:MAG: response regulator [Verrucomicrobiota bacterium]
MKGRILVIEDSDANLELMRFLLKAYGYTVFTALDGKEGLSSIRRDKPDLVICDIQLPGMDGTELAREIRNDAAFCSVPLVAVTAMAMLGDREAILAAGFDGYLSKPIEPQTFVAQVEFYLNQGRLPAV